MVRLSPANTRFRKGGRQRAFTLLEMMIVLVIMSIVTVLGMDSVNGFEEANRPERAARECLAYLRYARHMAMVTGSSAKVQLDTTAQTFAVYLMTNGTSYDTTPAPQTMATGGTMILNLTTAPNINGISMTCSANTFAYGPLGSCTISNTGNATTFTTATITFSFGTRSKVLTVPAVGDPQFN